MRLPAFDIFDFLPKDEPVEIVETSRTMPPGLKLKASAIEDCKLVSKAFFEFLYLTDVKKLFLKPHKIMR